LATINPRLLALIDRYAPQYRLDPRAVAAIAMNESGGRFNAVGDNGSSFGPWQLHVGGALPPGKTARWAESLPGILYALRQMGSVAGGLRGQAAVAAIAQRFERPANPAAEIATALSYYRQPGFARGTAVAGMGGGGSVGGGGAAARMKPLGGFIPAPISVQPAAPMASPESALQTFIAAHTPQANGLPAPPVSSLFPQVAPSASSLAGSLDSIHAKLVK
jgi:hypothetical protein